MKVSLKIMNLETSNDVQILRSTISNEEGIIACEINKSKKEIIIVFDDIVINEMKIITSIENEGYSIG